LDVFGLVVILVLAVFLCAIIGCGLMLRGKAVQIREAHRLGNAAGTISSLRWGAFGCLLLGLWFGFTAANSTGLIFWPALVAALSILPIPLLLYGASLIRRQAKYERRARVARPLEWIGALLVISPLLMVGSWPILVVLILLAMAGVHLAASKRRMDHGTVLWSLALASRGGPPLSRELDTIAEGLSAQQRRRVIRLSKLVDHGGARGPRRCGKRPVGGRAARGGTDVFRPYTIIADRRDVFDVELVLSVDRSADWGADSGWNHRLHCPQV
jgi:hypothetical protein